MVTVDDENFFGFLAVEWLGLMSSFNDAKAARRLWSTPGERGFDGLLIGSGEGAGSTLDGAVEDLVVAGKSLGLVEVFAGSDFLVL